MDGRRAQASFTDSRAGKDVPVSPFIESGQYHLETPLPWSHRRSQPLPSRVHDVGARWRKPNPDRSVMRIMTPLMPTLLPTLVVTQDPSTGYVSTGTPQPTDVQGWALKTREAGLSAQLAVLVQRRDALSQQARTTTGPTRAGLETQLSQVNRLIAEAQADLAEARSGTQRPVHFTFDAPVVAPARISVPPRAVPNRSDDVAMMGIAASTMLLLPFVLLLVQRLWRRGAKPPAAQEWSGGPDRLRRLEQAVDTIAIEVERISESQRFTTRLLAESAAALGNGVASPLAVPVAAPVATGDPRRK